MFSEEFVQSDIMSNQDLCLNESGHIERMDIDSIPPQKNPNYRPKTREHPQKANAGDLYF